MNAGLDLTVAMCYYEHAAELLHGRVPVVGARLRWLELPVEEIFHRFVRFREWEVSEMSMANYVSLVADGDTSLVGLPVFPSRVFRHSGIFVRAGEITDPSDLRGRRIGIPEWSMTAVVYQRALLVHEWDIELKDVVWYQGGLNQRGRREKVGIAPPRDVELITVPSRSLDEMLLAGDLDAIFTAHPPASFVAGDPRVARLIPNPMATEAEYAERTGIVPIMHLVVVRADVVDRHPWVVGNLMAGFAEARSRSLGRLAAGPSGPGSRVPLLWQDDALARTTAAFGGEPWPYGVAANTLTLESFLQWSYEQGVTSRRLALDELFPAALADEYRI